MQTEMPRIVSFQSLIDAGAIAACPHVPTDTGAWCPICDGAQNVSNAPALTDTLPNLF